MTVWKNGNAVYTAQWAADKPKLGPGTGDNAAPAVWVLMVLIGLLGLAWRKKA